MLYSHPVSVELQKASSEQDYKYRFHYEMNDRVRLSGKIGQRDQRSDAPVNEEQDARRGEENEGLSHNTASEEPVEQDTAGD
jgi:hypothetical protein